MRELGWGATAIWPNIERKRVPEAIQILEKATPRSYPIFVYSIYIYIYILYIYIYIYLYLYIYIYMERILS